MSNRVARGQKSRVQFGDFGATKHKQTAERRGYYAERGRLAHRAVFGTRQSEAGSFLDKERQTLGQR